MFGTVAVAMFDKHRHTNSPVPDRIRTILILEATAHLQHLV